MDQEEMKALVEQHLSSGERFHCDGITLLPIENEAGEQGYALVFWDRGKDEPRLSVSIFSFGGLVELVQTVAPVVFGPTVMLRGRGDSPN